MDADVRPSPGGIHRRSDPPDQMMKSISPGARPCEVIFSAWYLVSPSETRPDLVSKVAVIFGFQNSSGRSLAFSKISFAYPESSKRGANTSRIAARVRAAVGTR